MHEVSERFLTAMQEAYDEYAGTTARSGRHTLVLNEWIIDELARLLPREYSIRGRVRGSRHRIKIPGRFFEKNVDVMVSRGGKGLAVIDNMSAWSSYGKNSGNYFKQHLGEIMNLRLNNLVYGLVVCLPNPIPILNRNRDIVNTETLRDKHIAMYHCLRMEHDNAGTPDEMAFTVFDLDLNAEEITDLTDVASLGLSHAMRRALRNDLSCDSFFNNMAERIEQKYHSP